MSQCHDQYELKRYRYSPPADITVTQCHDDYTTSEIDGPAPDREPVHTDEEEARGASMPPPGDDRLESVMSGDVVSADEGESLYELARTMIDEEVGSVVITNAGQVTGIVTQHDIVFAVADGMDVSEVRAGEVMSESPLCADISDSVDVTVERMAEAGVLHVPVLDGSRLRGLVSARDLMTRSHRLG